MNRSLPLALALLLSAPWALGCRGSSSSEPGAPNLISISDISPADGATLSAGGSVTFAATLDYALNSSGAAAITLIVQDQNGRVLNPDNEVTTIVSQGIGSVRLTGQAVVPAMGVSLVRVIFALQPTAPVSTQVTAFATYPVRP